MPPVSMRLAPRANSAGRGRWLLLSHQLAQLDVNKRAGLWARLYKQVKAAEARLRQSEQETSPSQTSPIEFAKHPSEFANQQPEIAKQQAALDSEEGEAQPLAEGNEIDERQTQLRAIASDLMYWKGGLKVLRLARLPKWRGHFKWQIEAKIEALQAAYARVRAEAAKPDG